MEYVKMFIKLEKNVFERRAMFVTINEKNYAEKRHNVGEHQIYTFSRKGHMCECRNNGHMYGPCLLRQHNVRNVNLFYQHINFTI